MEEILNIDHHRKQLVIKSLNKYNSMERAAKALGVSEKTLYRFKKNYGIVKVDDHYLSINQN